MAIQQKIQFVVGLNSDVAPEINKGFPFAQNVRILATSDGNDGALTTVNGNTIVPIIGNLPSGNNTAIGYCENKLQNKGYAFIYNDTGKHSIYEYDEQNKSVTKVFIDDNAYTGLADGLVLNFQIDYLITGCCVVELDKDNHLLYWTDNYVNRNDASEYNEPKKLNIEKSVVFTSGDWTGDYSHPFKKSFFDRIKAPPPAPSYVWSGLFNVQQFVAQLNPHFIETDPFGTITVIFQNASPNIGGQFHVDPTNHWVVPATGYYNVSTGLYLYTGANTITIHIDIKNETTSTVLATSGNIDIIPPAAQFHEITVDNIFLTLGDVVDVKITEVSATNPGDLLYVGIPNSNQNTFSATFLGTDGIRINNNFKRLYQFQQSYVYNDKEQSVLSKICSYVLPNTGGNTGTGEDYIQQDSVITVSMWTGNSDVKKLRLYGSEIGATQPLDTLLSTVSLIVEIDKEIYELADNTTYNFTFLNDGNYIPISVQKQGQLMDFVPLYEQALANFKNRIADANYTEDVDAIPIDARFPMDFSQTVQTNANSYFPALSYLKSGAIYQECYNYGLNGGRITEAFTAIGKSSDLNPNNGTYGTQVHIPFLNETGYTAPYTADPDLLMQYVPTIKAFTYHHPVPDSINYEICRSKQQNIQQYIQFTSQYIRYVGNADWTTPVDPNTADYITINIGNIINRYKDENPNSQLVYDWTKGDRIRFIGNAIDFVGRNSQHLGHRYPYSDSEIVDFNNILDETVIIRTGSAPLTMSDNTGVNLILFEIYTPARNVENDNELVYEVGENGLIQLDANGNKAHFPTDNGLGIKNQLFENFDSATWDNVHTATVHKTQVGVFNANDNVKITGLNNAWSIYGFVVSSIAGTITINTTGFTMFGTFANTAGEIVRAAEQTFSSGDCFRRYCDMPAVDPNTGDVYRFYSYIETMEASNMYDSKAWDFGRAILINNNAKRITRPATVSYSEALIPETTINGLSTVFDLSFENYSTEFGGIMKLFYQNERLIAFQNLKVLPILTEQQVIASPSGAGVITTAPNILSNIQQIDYYLQDFGIGEHPESFAYYANRKYFYDVKRAGVIRLSNDGLINVSNEAGMSIYFAQLSQMILSCATKVNCVGTYDTYFGEYILAVEPFNYGKTQPKSHDVDITYSSNTLVIDFGVTPLYPNGRNVFVSALDGSWSIYGTIVSTNGTAQTIDTTGYTMQGTFDGTINAYLQQHFIGVTISFNEDKNQFSTTWSYIPDYMGQSGVDIISFKNGHIYSHNDNPLQGNFYGVQYGAVITFYINVEPSKVKVLLALSQETSNNWICTEITTPDNQLTMMKYDSNWVKKENNYYASVKMDINTPNAVGNPIITGQPMRNRTFKVTMQYNKSNYSKLFAINAYVIQSERSNH